MDVIYEPEDTSDTDDWDWGLFVVDYTKGLQNRPGDQRQRKTGLKELLDATLVY
jgi:hypothetical protein